MHCPFCQEEETKVVDSRLVSEGAQVRRRRECLECHARFTTFETAELMMPSVIKRDGRRKPFSLEKLRTGILRSLEKRPVSVDALEETLISITQEIRNRGDREIDSQLIGELVMKRLYPLDHVAYVRFASVYKRFQDVSDFQQTIDQMME